MAPKLTTPNCDKFSKIEPYKIFPKMHKFYSSQCRGNLIYTFFDHFENFLTYTHGIQKLHAKKN